MKIIIDRFEGEWAIVEMTDGKMINCPRVLLPDNVKEGDIISIIADAKETEKKKIVLTDRMNRLFKD